MRTFWTGTLLGFLCTGFLLGIHDGHLALWEGADPEPVHVFELPENDLPPADRVLLRRGIRAGTREELFVILEDYL